MTPRIVGTVILSDGFPDVLRCISSLERCCEEIYIAHGGGKDGTLEWLYSVKDIFRLKLYERPFDTMREQRNFLLSKVPQDVWVINIDNDEALNVVAADLIPQWVAKIDPKTYEEAHREQRIVTMDIPYLQLIEDFKHYTYPFTYLRGKTFYNTDNVQFYHLYHSEVSYHKDRMSQYVGLSVPEEFAIYHYAHLDPRRMESRKERLANLLLDSQNSVEWEYNVWFGEHDIRLIPSEKLPLF